MSNATPSPSWLSASDPRRSGLEDADGRAECMIDEDLDAILTDLVKAESRARSVDLKRAITAAREIDVAEVKAALERLRSRLATCLVCAEDEGRREDGPSGYDRVGDILEPTVVA